MKKEQFEWEKFKKIFYLGSLTEWIKSVKEIIDLRKLIIYTLILGIIFAWGWHKGKQGLPVILDLGYGQEATIKLDGSYFHIYKDGSVWVEDEKGNKIKQITVKDIPELQRKLRPYGIQLQLIAVGGISSKGEGGIGLSWLKYFKFRGESFLTNKGIYPIGIAYKVTSNSGAGAGIGKGYDEGDTRVIGYYRWDF